MAAQNDMIDPNLFNRNMLYDPVIDWCIRTGRKIPEDLAIAYGNYVAQCVHLAQEQFDKCAEESHAMISHHLQLSRDRHIDTTALMDTKDVVNQLQYVEYVEDSWR